MVYVQERDLAVLFPHDEEHGISKFGKLWEVVDPAESSHLNKKIIIIICQNNFNDSIQQQNA